MASDKDRHDAQEKLLAELEVGQVRSGMVTQIADFGAFVDIGGINGLLHSTDMSYSQFVDPGEIVSVDQLIDVMVLSIERESFRISLGLKQLQTNPWEGVEERYPIGSSQNGQVIRVMNYGALLELEPGIEGLLHMVEIARTKRINHPTELIAIGDNIEVCVLAIDRHLERMSLGIRTGT